MMRRYTTLTCLIVLLLMGLHKAVAQTNISIGTGTATNTETGYPCPLQDYGNRARSQYLYTAAELKAAGMGPGGISALSFNVLDLRTVGVLEGYAISIGTTTAATLATNSWESGTTTVYGPANYQPVTGTNLFTFSTPFSWNGVDNIIIEICSGEAGAAKSSKNAAVAYSTVSFYGQHTYRDNTSGVGCGIANTTAYGTLTYRPNIVFAYTAAPACTGTPVAGTVTADAANLCLARTVDLRLNGNSIASGLTYQWQSSPDNTTWTNISGATSQMATATQIADSWYRCVVTCSGSGLAAATAGVQVLSPVLPQGSFTINSAQVTGGTNFQTFAAAIDYLKCGISGPVVFNVVAGSGPYNEQVTINAIPGSSATNTITINGNGNTLDFVSYDYDKPYVIGLNGADYITINNLTITAFNTSSSGYGYCVQLTNDADYNTIANCTISNGAQSDSYYAAGIVINGGGFYDTNGSKCDNNTITGNTITGGIYNIAIRGDVNFAAGNNRIVNNQLLDGYLGGISAQYTYKLQVAGNKISRPARTNSQQFYYAIDLANLNTQASIAGNIITNPFGADLTSLNNAIAINCQGVNSLTGLENRIENNLVYNMNGRGENMGMQIRNTNNTWFYNNTIVMDGNMPAGTAGTYGVNMDAACAANIFKYNVIAIARTGVGNKYCMYSLADPAYLDADKNNYFIAAGVQSAYIGYKAATLAAWQAASGLDKASVSTNPVFADPATGNFLPRSSVMDDLGEYVSIDQDITGAARSHTTPDIGAYEYTAPVCTTPPTAGTTISGKNPVCVNTSVVLSLSGNSVGKGQTYQWQTATAITGPFTDLGAVLSAPDTIITSATSLYYRVAVTCSGNTSYSTPVLLTVNPAMVPNTYTINKGAAASATNFTSFATAADALSCGITGPVVFNVVAGSGPYEEQLHLDTIRGTSAVNTITFNGNGNTIHFSSNVTTARGVIMLDGTDHVILDSLTIDATGTGVFGYGVQLMHDADSNVIRRCNIVIPEPRNSTDVIGVVINNGTEDWGDYVGSFADGNLVERCVIAGGYTCIQIIADKGLSFNNRILNNDIKDFYSNGVRTILTDQTTIAGNRFSRPNSNYQIYFVGVSASDQSRMVINGNVFTNPFGNDLTNGSGFTAVELNDNRNNTTGGVSTVSNNVIYGINGDGGATAFYNSWSDNVNYYHNTVDISTTSNNNLYGFNHVGEVANVQMQNNSISIKGTGTGEKYAVYEANSTSQFITNNNNYFVNGANAFIGYYSNNGIANFADWQAVTAQDAKSINIEPVYANLAGGDLTPVISPFDNAGASVGVATDILGKPRNINTPDIGAYEITIPACTAPPVPGTAVVTPAASICLGDSIKLTLTGNSTGGTQTFQWQMAKSASGPWTNIGNPQYIAELQTKLTFENYFRCAVVCGGDTAFSTVANVNMNAAFAAGDYTINPAAPASATNFQTFSSAVAALECGIDGNVNFHASPATYSEQVYLHPVPGAGPDGRVTFYGETGTILTYTAANDDDNYVIKLDSANYITFNGLTIQPGNKNYGNGVVFTGTASFDSILNCKITMPATTSSGTTTSGVYGNAFTGHHNVIKGNTIQNGTNGVYLNGNGERDMLHGYVVDSNKISGVYRYGLVFYYMDSVQANKNTIDFTGSLYSKPYGIYLRYADTGCVISHNTITINNTAAGVYGMYIYYCFAKSAQPNIIEANTIIAGTGNTGSLYGIYKGYGDFTNLLNNVVSINTTNATVYGLYVKNDENSSYYNNTIANFSTATGTANAAAYIGHDDNSRTVGYNNIFYHGGGNVALTVADKDNENLDYNLLYSTGAVLATTAGVNYNNLPAWVSAAGLDEHSLVYKPAFVSNTDLHPAIASADVWALQGRGVQVLGNNHDFNDSARAEVFATGVPDLGAYEFTPTSEPAALTAIPAAPAVGGTQVFMMGSDTVAQVKWNASAAAPSSVIMRRYTGTIAPDLPADAEYMYFYTKIESSQSTLYTYDLTQHYLDPWQGTVRNQSLLKLGRTNAAGKWISSGDTSMVHDQENYIVAHDLHYIDKFTGLIDSTDAVVPVLLPAADSSNMGTRFWVGYGHNWDFEGANNQDMVIYLSADQAANVTLRVNGTSFVKHYSLTAHSVIATDPIPKSGLDDARLLTEGIYDRGICIESDVPVVAYAHIYDGSNSGATMLLPVGTYGYEYLSLNYTQHYDMYSHSWLNVVADQPNTVVEITPSVPTWSGQPANVPFRVTLGRGQVLQLMGAMINGQNGFDLTGTRIRSVSNSQGKCYPIAVFSGSSRASVGCSADGTGGNGDNFIQQCFPSQAWGKRYLTAPTSTDDDATVLMQNVYRVLVKDPATVVKLNGKQLTGLINGRFYQYTSMTADYIEANQPVMVAEYMASRRYCSNTAGYGDPEMIYLSPIEQGIKQVGFYRNTETAIMSNYLTLVIPDNGVKSLKIDGTSNFDYTYKHPNLSGYTVVVKRWEADKAQALASSDSAFTGITYGLGDDESYGYNAGTLVKVLNTRAGITNVYGDTTQLSAYTCPNTPFKISFTSTTRPQQITWQVSQVSYITPSADIVQQNPIPVDSFTANGRKYYTFVPEQQFTVSKAGMYYIPVVMNDVSFEGCDNNKIDYIPVTVIAAPNVSFTYAFNGCVSDTVHFTGNGATSNGVAINKWKWNFGNGAVDSIQSPQYQYTAGGDYTATLQLIAIDGCIADTAATIEVKGPASAILVKDSLVTCMGTNESFSVQSPSTDVVYNWYDATGALIYTGSTLTISNAQASAVYYLETIKDGCYNTTRAKAVLTVLPQLTAPVVIVDSAGVSVLRFSWAAVPNATGYEVSTDGLNWITPNGTLSHTITGLQPSQEVTLHIRALGCETVDGNAVTGTTLVDGIYIPNAFTPNGDAVNDVLKVYGAIIHDMHLMIFDQWGEKLFETDDQQRGWDGNYSGKPQPSGVYMYVCRMHLIDGSTVEKKGVINLIR